MTAKPIEPSTGPARLLLGHLRVYRWRTAERPGRRAHAIGHTFDHGRLLDAAAIAAELADAAAVSLDHAAARVRALGLSDGGGWFAAIVETPDGAVAFVDHVRSFPLYWAIDGDRVVISDDAEAVRDAVGADRIDERLADQLRLSLYVMNEATLVPPVSAMLAGQLIIFRVGPGGAIVPERDRWYRFLPNRGDVTEAEHAERAPAVLEAAFERMLRSIGDRPILLPLSGGMDSRLVAVMLKRLGARNVRCYSFGPLGSPDVNPSQAVAAALGFPWRHVPLTYANCRRWFRDPLTRRYMRYADGLHMTVLYIEFAAMCELRKAGAIPEGAVFVPGHGGDVPSGSHVDDFAVDPAGPHDRAAAIANVLRRHFCLWDWSCKTGLYPQLAAAVDAALPPIDVHDGATASAACECWDWQERQIKYIGNSVRLYELFGYEWRMPLWDLGRLDLLGGLSVTQRYRRDAVIRWLERDMFEPLGVGSIHVKQNKPMLWRSQFDRVVKRLLFGVARHLPRGPARVLERITRADWGRFSIADAERYVADNKTRYGNGPRTPWLVDLPSIMASVNLHEIRRRLDQP